MCRMASFLYKNSEENGVEIAVSCLNSHSNTQENLKLTEKMGWFEGHYLPNGQAAKSGLNKSWNDAAFGQFFATLDYIAAKAGAVVIAKNPAYTSMVLSYRNELIFTDCSIRGYWDEAENLMVDRDVNAAINLKRVGP